MSEDTGSFLAVLVTIGRITGREHAVKLKAVLYKGSYYFSRRRPDSDWFKNAACGGAVRIIIGGMEILGTASEETDQGVIAAVSELKYPGEPRALEARVAIRVTPGEPQGASQVIPDE